MRLVALLSCTILSCQSCMGLNLTDQESQVTADNPSRFVDTAQAPPSDGVSPVAMPKPATDVSGTLTIQYENDTFSDRSDNNFTAGFGAAWTSAAVQTMSEENWFRMRIADVDFLPTVGSTGYLQFLQFALNYEMYTAQDISDPDPPLDAHPYSGIIALDTAVYSMSDVESHSYWLRLGLVGPATQGEEIQNSMHEATGRPLAQGWDTQLSNEFFVNLFYAYQRRLLRKTVSREGFGYDLCINGGLGLGTYYTGANLGGQMRLGFGLPQNFERSYPLSLYEELPHRRLEGGPFSFYIHAQFTGTGVARFLPIDGNTWTSSRSGARDDWFAQLNIGATLSYGRLVLTYRTNLAGSGIQHEHNDDDFSAITISYVFQ